MSTVPQSTSSGSGHETRDADVPFILLTAFGLLLAVVLIGVGVWIALTRFHAERSPRTAANLAADKALFPQPQLQADPTIGLARMRERDTRELSSYGWIDQKAGTAHIPIDRAMQLLLEKGLPDVGQNQTPLSLMQARPAADETPSASPQPKS